MAITTISITDPVSALVTKTNTISTGLGDVVTLYGGYTNTVTAINALNTTIGSTSSNLQDNIDSAYDDLSGQISTLESTVEAINATTISNTQPSSPADGDLWYDTGINYRLYIYSSTSQAWIDASPANIGEIIDSALEDLIQTSIFDKITLEAGSANGLRFRDDPYGGSGDGASITLVQKTGEDISLRIAVTNDAADTIDFVATNNNGLTMNTYPVLHTGNFDNMYHLVAEGTLGDPDAPTTGEFNGKKFLLVY